MASLDPKREDQPRILIVTLQHWQRVRADYTNVLVARLDARLAAAGMTQDRELYMPHINQVGCMATGMTYMSLITSGAVHGHRVSERKTKSTRQRP